MRDGNKHGFLGNKHIETIFAKTQKKPNIFVEFLRSKNTFFEWYCFPKKNQTNRVSFVNVQNELLSFNSIENHMHFHNSAALNECFGQKVTVCEYGESEVITSFGFGC